MVTGVVPGETHTTQSQFLSYWENADQTWEERIDDMVSRSIKTLKESQLVTCNGDETEERTTLSSTDYGLIMSKVSRVA